MKLWIKRYYEDRLSDIISPGKITILYGPRRVGKTSLLQKYLNGVEGKVFIGTGDDRILRDIIESENVARIQTCFKGYDYVFIDEAQRITNVGNGLKIIADYLPELRCIATGSSSFGLAHQVGEPLTGRHRQLLLYPIASLEIAGQTGRMDVVNRLEDFLIFGSYPEVLTAVNVKEKIEYLISLRDSYLLKDVFELEHLKNPSKLWDLLKLLSFQIGKLVSLNELSQNLGIAKQTVERYLFILEKAFVIKKIGGFSRNLRKEISKMSRYYFWDNGIRNAIINNFNYPDIRNDTGMLWENYLFIERLKRNECLQVFSNNYFWRTYDQKEIDFIEDRGGKLYGYEFKWTSKKRRSSKLWLETYNNAEFKAITRDNFLEFVL